MSLAIIRYMNCGTKFRGETQNFPGESKPIHTDEEYFSFFELNNEKVIYICFIQDFIDKKPTTTEIDFQYAEDYYFLDDFYVWWRKQMDIDEEILENPTKEEKALVEKFFRENVEKIKEIKTEIIYL